MSAQKPVSEGKLLFLIGAVQFINVLDFMMVMPLGPDFSKSLGISNSSLGLIGGIYTASAAVSGFVGATFLDRFDRRKALACALAGLVIATAAGGFAFNLPSLLAARVGAGAFGGPATALCLAIITDAVPVERRGRAMGAFMGSFSIASVLGVPAGLELARVGGWRFTFFAVAALGLLIVPLAFSFLPPLRSHLERAQGPRPSLVSMLRPTTLLALSSTVVAMISMFSLVPNIATFVQLNLGYPRERLGLLYLVGGVCSFFTMRVAGWLTDRYGPAIVATGGVTVFAGIIYLSFINPQPSIPILPLFSMFMITSGFRFVPMQALSSRVPTPQERARFMSLQSGVQHLASAFGAVLSSQILSSSSSGALIGMEKVGWMSIAFTSILPFFLFALQSRLTPIPVRQQAPQAA